MPWNDIQFFVSDLEKTYDGFDITIVYLFLTVLKLKYTDK